MHKYCNTGKETILTILMIMEQKNVLNNARWKKGGSLSNVLVLQSFGRHLFSSFSGFSDIWGRVR